MTADLPHQPERPSGWHVSAAGAFVGVAAGVFLVSVLSHIDRMYDIRVGSYEPLVAFLGAFGVWLVSPGRGVRQALFGASVALAAMIIADLFLILATTLPEDWRFAPLLYCRSFRLTNWPRLLRYGFGLYIGWHLCFAGRERPVESTLRTQEEAC